MIDLLKKNRSIRRFYQDRPVSMETLRELVECARISPSARNLQPLRYVLSRDSETNARIFPHLGWAGYLTDWPGPDEGERPAAFIIICADREISGQVRWDDGICAHSILLAAAEMGLGGCMIGTIDKKSLSGELGIPERYEICLVVALGVPKETVVMEPVQGGNIRYYRDGSGVHHVPKRSLDEIILDLPK